MSSRTLKPAHVLALLTLVLVLAIPSRAQAEDRSASSASRARVGDQFTMHFEVLVPQGVEVEIDSANPAWAGLHIIRVDSVTTVPEGDEVRHMFEVTVAPFGPGNITVVPMFTTIVSGLALPRPLPPIDLEVVRTLPADAPLELNPLPEPAGVAGAESRWLRPGIAAGVLLALVLLAIGAVLLRRWLGPKLRGPETEEEPEPEKPADLGGAERLLDVDPVGAYRALATVVRRDLFRRYGLPATALTTTELTRRMDAEAIDRWQARLVTGLLQECDAVVYAGYVPAPERRRADLDMARQIVEAV